MIGDNTFDNIVSLKSSVRNNCVLLKEHPAIEMIYVIELEADHMLQFNSSNSTIL